KRVEPVVPQSTEQGWYIDKSRFDFHIDPVLNQSVGGPENFYMYQLGVMGTADLWLTDHLLTTGSLFANLANNYDKFNYTNPPQDSHLPRVRTHVREYVQNDVYVNNLQANYFQHLGNGFYGQVYGGYLETMFGGAGAEVLYRPLDSNSASVQLFPWLETTLRYTDVRTRQYSSVEAFSGDQTYKDKAFDLKLRLWEESYWLPQVAVGARDIGGTGLFDAEYLVASKAWGPFDFTLGLGWGYLGTSGNVKNPLCSASDKYCYRDNSYKQAGSIDGSQMFHGPASLFGGVEYQTPWQPLRLKLEYEGNNYQQDFAGKLEQKSKFNVGAIYRVTDWADVNLSYERGNTFMFGVTLRTNFNDLRPSYNDNARPQYQPQPQDAILQHSVVANQLTLLKYNAGLADPQIQAKGDTLYVTGEQVKYRDSREGIIRANRIVMNDLPDGIKTIRITENRLNMPQVTTETDVASLKNHLAGEPLGHETTLAQ
ncbi:YjbH domain-containing protein, partial [Escherichia coli]